MRDPDDMAPYFSGKTLYGDDFTPEQIEAWYLDEEAAYDAIKQKSPHPGEYDYHALNYSIGFRFLPHGRFEHALGFGSYHGEELLPIADRLREITVVDPAAPALADLAGVPVRAVKPRRDGRIEVLSESVDLFTCLGVLHHLPNVSFVVSELFRCTKSGGWGLLREPTVTMGDWRKPRFGLTARERGIPPPVLERAITRAGFLIVRRTDCVFPLTKRLAKLLRLNPYNTPGLVQLDILCSRVRMHAHVYHPTKWWHKLQCSSRYFVLRKP
jgi:hypothetical protein